MGGNEDLIGLGVALACCQQTDRLIGGILTKWRRGFALRLAVLRGQLAVKSTGYQATPSLSWSKACFGFCWPAMFLNIGFKSP